MVRKRGAWDTGAGNRHTSHTPMTAGSLRENAQMLRGEETTNLAKLRCDEKYLCNSPDASLRRGRGRWYKSACVCVCVCVCVRVVRRCKGKEEAAATKPGRH